MQARVAAIIEQYDAQGDHRTGTDVDARSAEWLASCIKGLGVEPEFDTFSFKRLQCKTARLQLDGLVIEGVPLFDCTYTDQAGIAGALGPLGSDAEIGVAMGGPVLAGQDDEVRRQAVANQLEQARRNGNHRAVVLVTDSNMPPGGVATMNAPQFLDPYGPPVLQVPNQYWPQIQAALQRRARSTVIVDCEYVAASSCNVQATIRGTDTDLAPLVVMTPRSGWWPCASERGGGIAAFLEILRALSTHKPARTVIFTANSGHELGHIGLDQYLDANPGLVKQAHAWIHLGANFAASINARIRLQYSDEEFRALVRSHCRRQQIEPGSEAPCGKRPAGEARNIFDGGGRYISIIGSNGLFHHPLDRYPHAVDVTVASRWSSVLVGVAIELAATP